jgi:hypothetical protein
MVIPYAIAFVALVSLPFLGRSVGFSGEGLGLLVLLTVFIYLLRHRAEQRARAMFERQARDPDAQTGDRIAEHDPS